MTNNFDTVRDYVLELEYNIVSESSEDGMITISKEGTGVFNMVLGIAEPILIMEQFLFEMNSTPAEVLQALLIKNRDIVHGAFVLDESGKKVIFRDTLQIENLDLNELEGSLNSLSLLLAEYTDELITFSKN